MYKLVTAVLFRKHKPKGFEEIDVGNTSINTLFNSFVTGYLVLEHSVLTGELFLTLETMRSMNLGVVTYDTTINQWLSLNGNKVLPHILKEPSFDFSEVRYADAYQAGFKSKAVHPSSTVEGYPLSSLTALYLKKDMVDGDILKNNSIFSVNGYLHSHTPYLDGVKVLDGTRSVLHSNFGHVGVLSFQGVGGVELINLTVDKINKTKDDIKLYEECYINIGQSLETKTILISVAGMLIHAKDVLNVFDATNGMVALSLSKINLIDRIQRAVNFIEFKSLIISERDYRVNPIDIEYIQSDAFIKELLTMTQTFIIVVNKPHLAVKDEPVLYGNILGRYFSPNFSYKPMIDEFGRLVPYFYQGRDKHPFMKSKHVFTTPKEYCEREFNIRDTSKWRFRKLSAHESTTYTTKPMHCSWLTLQFLVPS